jgi:hypothetical protein
VPGTAYSAAESFTTNGQCDRVARADRSSEALVSCARANGIKVNVGEIAVDAGLNRKPTYQSTLPIAQAQWAI